MKETDILEAVNALVGKKKERLVVIDTMFADGHVTANQKLRMLELTNKNHESEVDGVLYSTVPQSRTQSSSVTPAVIPSVPSNPPTAGSVSTNVTFVEDQSESSSDYSLISAASSVPTSSRSNNKQKVICQEVEPTTSLGKRTRFATKRLDPSGNEPKKIENDPGWLLSVHQHNIAKDTIHRQSDAFEVLKRDYGWKSVRGKKPYIGQYVYVVPGSTYKLEAGPVLGKDFFLDAQEALKFAQSHASKEK